MYERYFEQATYYTEATLVKTLLAFMYNEGYTGDVETFDSIDAIDNGEDAIAILKGVLENVEDI
tara:strand:+ start:4003 stop:4194 length:192 start_codon:yes stop_codon:yes gene_type:complete